MIGAGWRDALSGQTNRKMTTLRNPALDLGAIWRFQGIPLTRDCARRTWRDFSPGVAVRLRIGIGSRPIRGGKPSCDKSLVALAHFQYRHGPVQLVRELSGLVGRFTNNSFSRISERDLDGEPTLFAPERDLSVAEADEIQLRLALESGDGKWESGDIILECVVPRLCGSRGYLHVMHAMCLEMATLVWPDPVSLKEIREEQEGWV